MDSKEDLLKVMIIFKCKLLIKHYSSRTNDMKSNSFHTQSEEQQSHYMIMDACLCSSFFLEQKLKHRL